MEIAVTLPGKKKEREDLMKSLDRRDEYGDDKSFWLVQNVRPDEITMESDGELRINYGTDTGMSVFISIPFAELIEQFGRFDFFGQFDNACDKVIEQQQSSQVLMKKIKELVK